MKQIAVLAILTVLISGCLAPEQKPTRGEDETPVTQITLGPNGEDRDPEVFMVGNDVFLCYATTTYTEHFDIYLKQVGSNMVRRVTSAPSQERFPKVHPKNPNMLAFCSDRDGEWDIYVIEDLKNDPNRWTKLSQQGTDDIHPSWSPDGKRLIYCAGGSMPDDPWVLKIVDYPTGATYTLEQIDGLLPEWSPSGDRIVFQRMRQRDNWFSTIWTVRFQNGAFSNPTMVFGDGNWAAINPSWSPDGSHIIFATVGKSPARRDKLEQADDIWSIRADATHARQLTRLESPDWMPSWGPDGRIYFLSCRDGGSTRVWSMQETTVDLPAAANGK